MEGAGGSPEGWWWVGGGLGCRSECVCPSVPWLENVRGVEIGSHLEHLSGRVLCGPAGHGCARAGAPRSATLSSIHCKEVCFLCLPCCSTREGLKTASEN